MRGVTGYKFVFFLDFNKVGINLFYVFSKPERNPMKNVLAR